MIAINYSTMRDNFKSYCDTAVNKYETVIITRKEEKNVVLLSLEKYNNLMKAFNNAEYLAMLDRSVTQLASGKGQSHELIEVSGDE